MRSARLLDDETPKQSRCTNPYALHQMRSEGSSGERIDRLQLDRRKLPGIPMNFVVADRIECRRVGSAELERPQWNSVHHAIALRPRECIARRQCLDGLNQRMKRNVIVQITEGRYRPSNTGLRFSTKAFTAFL